MKKKIISTLLLVCFLLTFTACNNLPAIPSGEATEFPVKIGHGTIEQAVSKVVVLNDSIADILIACGYTDKIVGRSDLCTQEALNTVQEVGKSDAPDVDKIKSAGAQAVFADESLLLGTYENLQQNGIQVFRMTEATSAEALKKLYSTLSAVFEGNITGRAKGEAKADDVFAQMAEKTNTIPETQIVPSACYIFDIDGNTITGKMVGNLVFESAGAINIARDINGSVLSFETLKTENPNYIFCAEGLKETIQSHASYKTINAVKRNRVYEIPAVEMTRQGLTMVTAVETMIELLYNTNAELGPLESVADEYGINLFEGISYTLDEEDAYVLAIQNRLDDLGYLPIEPTGYFGDSTAKAVESFQTLNNTSRRDGIADEETLTLLFSTSAIESETPAR